jgi:hypothetical protein
MEQIGGGIFVKVVHEGAMSSVVLPGKVGSVWHVVTSSRFVVPVLLLRDRMVGVSVRGGMINSAGLREVKLILAGAMNSSLIGPILLSGGSIKSASLGLRSGIEVGLGIVAQLQILNMARCCPETFMPWPTFAEPAWKAGSEPTRHLLLDCRIWIHGIGGERHKESRKCDTIVVMVRIVENGRVSIGEACVQRLSLLGFC